MQYKPEIVLITGATGDFGRAFAHHFAEIGSNLILHGRNADKIAALQAEITAKYPISTEKLVFDITDKAAMLAALAGLPAAWRGIDLLINNAGGALGLDKAQNASIEDWEGMIDANVTSLVRLTHALLPDMVACKRGHIINIGSIAGNWPYPGGHVYCASKAFVKQFSLALRSDLIDTQVRVTNIEPGMVETQFSLKRFKGDADKAASVYAGANPLLADDIARTAVWVATQPPHMNVSSIEVLPTTQANGPLIVHRGAV